MPGPTSYEIAGGFDSVVRNLTSAYSLRQLENFKPSTSFASSVARFKYKTFDKVGPGSYNPNYNIRTGQLSSKNKNISTLNAP